MPESQLHTMHLAAAALILACIAGCATSSGDATCVMHADGSLPPAGACAGPSARAVLTVIVIITLHILSAVSPADDTAVAAVLRYAQNNSGCAISQVAYLVDGGTKVSCGQCRPGETGLGFADHAAELSLVLSLANYDPSVEAFPFQSGALFSCATNEFCTDAAICAPLVSSPLFGLPCPLEAPSDNWCGPGLHCIAHRCQICSEGAMDITRSRLCLNGIWTSDPWTLAARDPCAWALAGILALLLLQLAALVFGLVKMKTASAKSRTSSRAKEREQSDKSAKPILSANSALVTAMDFASGSNPLFQVHVATEGNELKQTCIETAESPVEPVHPAHVMASLDPAVTIENAIL